MRLLLQTAALGLLLLAPAFASEPFDLEAVRLDHDPLRAGEPASIRVTVRNHGPGPAAGVRCTVGSQGRTWGVLHARKDLRAGEEIVLEGTFTPPSPGSQELSATVAPEDSDARNQTIAEVVTIEAPRLPDLQIEELQVPRPLRAGEETRVDLWVANRGQIPTGGARITLQVDGKAVGTWRLQKRLWPGDREQVQMRWTPEREGRGTLTVEVDPDGAVAESDEANNRQEAPVEVAARRQVDLEAQQLLAPQPLRQGSAGEILVQVANNGDATAHSVRVRVTLDGQTVAERFVRLELPPHASRAIPISWVPKGAGDLELVASVDPESREGEALRNNNSVRGRVTVVPRAAADLQAVRLDSPDLRVGRPALLEAVVRNEGDLPAFGCRVILLADGAPVAIGNAQSGLEPGDEIRVPLKWTPDRPGLVKLEFEVEARPAGPERSLEDNRASLEVQVAESKGP